MKSVRVLASALLALALPASAQPVLRPPEPEPRRS